MASVFEVCVKGPLREDPPVHARVAERGPKNGNRRHRGLPVNHNTGQWQKDSPYVSPFAAGVGRACFRPLSRRHAAHPESKQQRGLLQKDGEQTCLGLGQGELLDEDRKQGGRRKL